MWLREEPKTIEHQSKARGKEISQDQLLEEGDYATVERQSLYDDHVQDLCHTEDLNAWDRVWM